MHFLEDSEGKNGDVWDSIEWALLREKVLARDKWKCRVCGRYAENAHHLTYALGILCDARWLISLCWSCHGVIHSHGNANKERKADS